MVEARRAQLRSSVEPAAAAPDRVCRSPLRAVLPAATDAVWRRHVTGRRLDVTARERPVSWPGVCRAAPLLTRPGDRADSGVWARRRPTGAGGQSSAHRGPEMPPAVCGVGWPLSVHGVWPLPGRPSRRRCVTGPGRRR